MLKLWRIICPHRKQKLKPTQQPFKCICDYSLSYFSSWDFCCMTVVSCVGGMTQYWLPRWIFRVNWGFSLFLNLPSINFLRIWRGIWDIFQEVWLLLPFSAYFPGCSHSSCVLERSTRLISARLCVSCRVSLKTLLAPLARQRRGFQTAWADGCLPNQSRGSLISFFLTSIYFPLASQDQNSAKLIINSLAVFLSDSAPHFLVFCLRQSWFLGFRPVIVCEHSNMWPSWRVPLSQVLH